jgi:hypothetical protein
LVARGASTEAEFQVVAAGGMDDWDRWCDGRDRTIMQAASPRYVGAGVYGAEDLDNYGSWTSVPDYGYVWRPTEGADWAPYQAGRWVWEDWYGWTWVSSDPWGWAPYHYGRWFHHDRFGWCWYPGLITARHYWSPALVGFFGFGGGGFGVGFGFGHVGWVALAPFEIFHPWWGRGYGGYGFNRSMSITNVNITNIYRNAQYRNGISAVAANDFQGGRFNNVMRTSGAQVGSAGLIHGQMPFTAGSANMRFSDRQATVTPRGSENARMFTHQQPNPVPRGQLGQAGQGAAGSRGQLGQAAQGAAVSRGQNAPAMAQNNRGQGSAQSAQGNAQGNEASGWRRFGSPSGQAAGQGSQSGATRNGTTGTAQAQRNDRPSGNQPSASRSNDNAGGWQRFGTAAPRQNNGSSSGGASQGQRYNEPSGSSGRQQSLRMAPPVVSQRPSYSAPRQSAPSYSAPRQSAPSYSAPRQSAPAPRSSGGGGGSSHGSSGGGGGSSSHGSSGGGGHSGHR